MRIFIDFEKSKIEKITYNKEFYQGANNVDVIRLLFSNINTSENWYPTLSGTTSKGKNIYPRLYDTNGVGVDNIDGVEYKYFDFTLSTENGWLLNDGLTEFYVWVNFSNTKNDCVGSFQIIIRKTSGFYQVDSPLLNPEIKVLINNTIDALLDRMSFSSPKGVFQTLSELVSKYPQGAEGVYVVVENGNWYYWDDKFWQEGGIYQGAVLPDNYIKKIVEYEDTKTEIINENGILKFINSISYAENDNSSIEITPFEIIFKNNKGEFIINEFEIVFKNNNNTITMPLNRSGEVALTSDIPRLLGPIGASLSLDYLKGIIKLLDKDGNVLSQVDLPTERILTEVFYDDILKQFVFEFENSEEVTIPLSHMFNANTDIDIKNISVAGKVKSQLVPSEDNKFNLGSNKKGWKNLYIGKIYHHIGNTTDENGNVIPKFSNSAVEVTDMGNGNKDYRTKVDLRVRNQSGSDESVFSAYASQYTSLKYDGVEFLKGYYDGLRLKAPDTGQTVIDASFSARGGINIGNDNLDILHPNKINIICTEDEDVDISSIGDIYRFNRIKFGGYEYVSEEDKTDYTPTATVFAYKKADSSDEVVPFAITKEGKVYYQGKELGGGNNNEFDVLKVGRIQDDYNDMASIELEGGSRTGGITLYAGGNEGSASISMSGTSSNGSGTIDLSGFTSISGSLSVNSKRVLTEDDLGDIEAILDRLNGEV